MTLYYILLLITAAFSYLVGGLSTIVLASNFVFKTNLRKLGRGNTFIVNFRRVYGLAGGLKLLAVEAVKDIVPMLVGGLLLGIKGHADVGRAFAGFCLVLGRCFPVYYMFRGSTAVLCLAIAGMLQAPSLGIAALVAYGAVLFLSKKMSISSFAAGLLFAVFSLLILDDQPNTWLMLMSGGLVALHQIPALIRNSKGLEQKLSLREDLNYKFDEEF